jgi:hypothetical protein
MSRLSERSIAVPMSVRLAVGLLQGVVLSLLYRAGQVQAWPATDGMVFAPLLVIGWCLPVVILAGISNMRGRTLAIWSGCAAALLVGLAVHDVLRDPDRLSSGTWNFWSLWVSAEDKPAIGLWPTMPLLPAVVVVLFVLHTFVVAGSADRKPIASYPTLFDTAWKHALQLGLSLAFVGIFWLVLVLGVGLFKLIGLGFLGDLVQHRWFAMPATSLAFACAVHVTDVRTGIVRGVRTLIHVLLSWLLPLMTLFMVGFLASLPFTGLEPLWSTRFATSLLVTAALATILLVNAAYQDGQLEDGVPWLLRRTASLACIVLVPLVVLAVYALALRVQQHGWTSDRIFAAAVMIAVGSCAIGYAWSVFRPGAWLKGIEVSNVVVALLAVGLVLALYSPLADPARISVADQVARLEAGKVAAREFDYAYLRFGSGRYGLAALEHLKDAQVGPDAGDIRQKAAAMLALQNRGARGANPAKAQDIVQLLGVYPAGRSLPEDFLRQDWATAQRWMLPECVSNGVTPCDAIILDLGGSGVEDILLIERKVAPGRGVLFRRDRDGGWRIAGLVYEGMCSTVLEALRAGTYKTAPPDFQDIVVDGHRVHVTPNAPSPCP